MFWGGFNMITAKEALARTKEARLTKTENDILSVANKGGNFIQLKYKEDKIIDMLKENGYVVEKSADGEYYVYWE